MHTTPDEAARWLSSKIGRIKVVRMITGCPLKVAKDAVERWCDAPGLGVLSIEERVERLERRLDAAKGD